MRRTAVRRGGVLLRELGRAAEFAQAQDVARAAWGFSDLSIPAASDLIAATHAGGLTAGAFEGGRMLGFVHGLARTNMGTPCHHSHMLAVRPEAQRRGLGVMLKLYQRRWCLERGIKLVTWTYDPLLVKNARLNLVRLRATARRYLRDFYGPMGGIYADLPTDRFEVEWSLQDPLVQAAAEGRPPAEPEVSDLPRMGLSRPLTEPRVGVEIPAGAPALYRRDLSAARQARLRLRRMAEALFSRGYAATSLAVEGDKAVYVFERT